MVRTKNRAFGKKGRPLSVENLILWQSIVDSTLANFDSGKDDTSYEPGSQWYKNAQDRANSWVRELKGTIGKRIFGSKLDTRYKSRLSGMWDFLFIYTGPRVTRVQHSDAYPRSKYTIQIVPYPMRRSTKEAYGALEDVLVESGFPMVRGNSVKNDKGNE